MPRSFRHPILAILIALGGCTAPGAPHPMARPCIEEGPGAETALLVAAHLQDTSWHASGFDELRRRAVVPRPPARPRLVLDAEICRKASNGIASFGRTREPFPVAVA